MTPQEQQMIDGLIDRIRSTQLTDRDPVAAAHLQQGLGSNPDAIYILAQTVLVQQQALLQAQQQLQTANNDLSQLRQNAGQAAPPASSSWLDRFFGNGSQSQQPSQGQGYPQQQSQGYPPQQSQPYGGGQAAYPPAPQQQPYGTAVYGGAPTYPPQSYPPQQGYPQQAYPPAYGYGQPQSGGGSFLRSAATTAAGVAAGALIFEGVESMFSGHHDGGYGYSGGHEGGTTINNYYDENKPEHHSEADTSGGDGGFYNPSHDASRDLGSEVNSATDSHQALSSDIEDRRGDTQAFADTGNNDSNAFADDSSFNDDSSSFDDGGSDDNGSSSDDSSY